MKDKDVLPLVDKVMEDYKGLGQTLGSAIGALIIGRRYGWKVLYLVHDKRTIRKYEKILGIKFRDELPEVGELAQRSVGYKLSQRVSNFWKAVSGELKVKEGGKERPVRDAHIE